MRSSALKYFGLVGVIALGACSGDGGDDGNSNIFTPTGGGSSGADTMGGSGTAGTAPGGSGGATAGTANGGEAGTTTDPTGGTGGATGGAGGESGGAAGSAAGDAGAAGTGGGAAGDITAVWPSSACGVASPPDNGTTTISVSGTKTDCARAGCGGLPDGAWTDTREYTIIKPNEYVNTTPYTLVFLGPGCGSGSTAIYGYDNNANNTIIRVGVRPSQNGQIQASHGTNPNQGCFDDKEGDDSVDFVLYEDLYDLLDTQLCFDKNRVFFGGNSSGAWWSNEHGCHYAGDPVRPVRGIMPNTGGLPSEPQFQPTCSDQGMAGMWVHETGDGTNPFSGNIYAINRAMTVNGCVAGQTYETAQFEDYPIPNNGANTCRRIVGCDPLFPLVVCPLNGNGHGSHDDVVNPGVSTFLQSFLAPPLAQ